jgi:hypothetical protein
VVFDPRREFFVSHQLLRDGAFRRLQARLPGLVDENTTERMFDAPPFQPVVTFDATNVMTVPFLTRTPKSADSSKSPLGTFPL